MKSKFRRGLGRILARGIVVAGLVFGGVSYGGNLRVYNYSSSQAGSSISAKHIEGATENYDNGIDSLYLNSPNPLQIYSYHSENSPPQDKLTTDARGPNSTTTFNLDLSNNGFSGTVDNSLKFKFNSGDDTNFEWKNIFLGDVNDSNDIVADIKYLIDNGIELYGVIYGTYDLPDLDGTDIGIYDKRKIIIRNHADLNRDRKVNGLDYAIFSNEWKKSGARFGSNVGSAPDDLGAYADIDRSGTVDFNDLDYFTIEWLWDANDPNTW